MAVETLADGIQTTLILVTRPEAAPLKEIERASHELAELGVRNQSMVINGVLADYDDTISQSLYDKQQKALVNIPKSLEEIQAYMIPLRAYNITGIENVRSLLTKDSYVISDEAIKAKRQSLITCSNKLGSSIQTII